MESKIIQRQSRTSSEERFRLSLFLFLLLEQVLPAVEFLFNDKPYTLCVQAVAGEISVIGLVVHANGKVSIRRKQVFGLEIANEAGGGCRVVPIAELAVDQQSVVEEATGKQSLILGIVPPLVARGYVGAKIPIVILRER